MFKIKKKKLLAEDLETIRLILVNYNNNKNYKNTMLIVYYYIKTYESVI